MLLLHFDRIASLFSNGLKRRWPVKVPNVNDDATAAERVLICGL